MVVFDIKFRIVFKYDKTNKNVYKYNKILEKFILSINGHIIDHNKYYMCRSKLR